MAVSKRTRYEVLRRDNHTCRYCHATDAPLTVDHVTPVALGGTDAPDNLVAACRDCNAGKSSSNPDATLVADVSAEALRHAELTKAAYAVIVNNISERHDYVEEVLEEYDDALPPDAEDSIGRWFKMGVPVELVQDAARTACRKTKPFTGTRRFTYFCGIVWNQIQAASEEVALKAAFDGLWYTDDALTNERIAAYEAGRESVPRTEPDVLTDVLVDFVDRGKLAPRASTQELMGVGH